jgi:hypothetical protein
VLSPDLCRFRHLVGIAGAALISWNSGHRTVFRNASGARTMTLCRRMDSDNGRRPYRRHSAMNICLTTDQAG